MEGFPCEAYYYRIGSNIRRLRREKQMTQEGLAEAAGLSFKMIQKLEVGQTGFRMETIIRIAITLDVSLDVLTDMEFEKMSSAYEDEQRELNQKRSDLKAKIKDEEKKTQNTNQFLETIRKYETVTELNRSMLVELIDSIYVYQAEGTGKERKQRVEINYRFFAGSQCGIACWKWINTLPERILS